MSGGHRGKGAGWYARLQAAIHNTTALKLAKYLIPAILLFLFLLSLVACKSPAVITNDTQHRARDSNYHATVHRIETHDTIIIRILPPPPRPSKSPLKGDFVGPSESPLRRLCSKRAVELAATQALFSRRGRLRARALFRQHDYLEDVARGGETLEHLLHGFCGDSPHSGLVVGSVVDTTQIVSRQDGAVPVAILL